jgi:uncharacterized membrane protein HdeD (DUF308 family)
MLWLSLGSLIAGIIIVSWPSGTVKVLAIIVGIQLIVFGLVRLFAALRMEERTDRWRWVHGVLAGLAVIAGILVLFHPFQTIALVALIVGLFWIAHGVSETFSASVHRETPHRGIVVGFGLFTLIAGIIVVTHPGGSVLALTLLIGIWLLVFGIFGMFRAFDLRSQMHGPSGRQPMAPTA